MKTEFLLIPNALDGDDYIVNLGKVKEIYGDEEGTNITFDYGVENLTIPFSTVFDLLKQYRENA